MQLRFVSASPSVPVTCSRARSPTTTASRRSGHAELATRSTEYYRDVPRGDAEGPIVLLYASRLSARKGVEMVLERRTGWTTLRPT